MRRLLRHPSAWVDIAAAGACLLAAWLWYLYGQHH